VTTTPRHLPGESPSGKPCSECGRLFTDLVLVRSRVWEGWMCQTCLAEARRLGAEVVVRAG
jgi:hypothetical protein